MKTAKFNKAEILKNAWISFKAQNIKTSEMFGICLKNAWNTAKGLQVIEVKPIEVKPEVKTLDFNKIYTDNYKSVFNFIKSKTDKKSDIDLIVNDTFLQVNKVLSTIQIDKDIKPFLFQIAKNKLIDFYRSERKHSYEFTDKVSDYIDEKGNEYRPTIATYEYNANIFENSEIQDKLNLEISKLNVNVSKCIRMFLDGYQYGEIAEILNIPISSVGVYVGRAKKVLHETMKNDYELYKAEY